MAARPQGKDWDWQHEDSLWRPEYNAPHLRESRKKPGHAKEAWDHCCGVQKEGLGSAIGASFPYALRQQGTIYVSSRGWYMSWILSQIEEAGVDHYHCCCCCYLQGSFELVQNIAYIFPVGPPLPRVPWLGGGGQLPCERQEYMVHPSLLQLPASLYHHRHVYIQLVPYPSFSLA